MNHIYKLIWNVRLGVWQTVSELAKGRQKGKQGKTHQTPLCQLITAGSLILISQSVYATNLPSGGQIIDGQGVIQSPQGTQLTIDQFSDKLIIDWNTFSIGQGHHVQFIQPDSQSAALNRVIGNQASDILGNLSANGRVFLINPNGISFSTDARVDVGSLVASTQQLSNQDFLAGNYQFSGNSHHAIINEGRITSLQGGTVALIAAKIINQGDITTPQGQTLMGAGHTVTLDLGGPVKIEVQQSTIETYIEQGGAIRADGGLIYLTAKAADALTSSVINHTGISQAHTLATGESGQIFLMGDMATGLTQVAGVLDASAPHGGDGGFIETSAARVTNHGVHVTTLSTAGQTGTWLIDPTDVTIGHGSHSDFSVEEVETTLQRTNMEINVIQGGEDLGNIYVEDALSWESEKSLTLIADNNIQMNGATTATQGGRDPQSEDKNDKPRFWLTASYRF